MPRITYCTVLAATLAVSAAATAAGQENRFVSPSAEDSGVRQARVTIDGEILFSVRGSTAYPAERRAEDIAGRIRALAANPGISATSITLENHSTGIRLHCGDVRIMTVLEEDAALEEITPAMLAEAYRTRISDAIQSYRRDRLPFVLWTNTAYAIAATFLAVAAVFTGRRVVRGAPPHIWSEDTSSESRDWRTGRVVSSGPTKSGAPFPGSLTAGAWQA